MTVVRFPLCIFAILCCKLFERALSSCSYLRKLQEQKGGQAAGSIAPDSLTSAMYVTPAPEKKKPPHSQPAAATNYCKKTNYVAVAIAQCGICDVNKLLQKRFAKLLSDPTLVRSKLFGAALRLVFHDTAEIDVRTADLLGPDGCLSDTPDNNGLREATTSLVYTVIEPLYQEVCDKISRADFWVLFAKHVVETAVQPVPLKLKFYYGRKDNTECTEQASGRLPSASGDLDEIARVFVHQMGLTLEDAVTLIGGGHSLGHVHPVNSGYGFTDGRENGLAATPPGAFPQKPASAPIANKDLLNAWDDTPDQLDNHYYQFMAQLPWFSIPTVPAPGNPVLTQWEDLNLPQIMLNTDMALAFPLNISLPQNQLCLPQGPPVPGAAEVASQCLTVQPTGLVNPTTVLPSTQYLSLYYVSHNEDFVRDFGVAFTKMTTLGYALPADCGFTPVSAKLGTLKYIDLARCRCCDGSRGDKW